MEEINIFTMFWNAGLIVKLVMLLLLTFSLLSWFIIFAKFSLYRKVRRESSSFLETFWSSRNLAEAKKAAEAMEYCPEAAIFCSGYNELQRLSATSSTSASNDILATRLAKMENLKRTLRKIETTEINQLGKSLQFLATTGSAAPFIGLFGTVWGIMTSFQNIGARGSASLAVVAPGISEALVATAAGLAVAIPAVIFYNHYSNRLAEIEGNVQNFSDDLLNLVERDLLAKQARQE